MSAKRKGSKSKSTKGKATRQSSPASHDGSTASADVEGASPRDLASVVAAVSTILAASGAASALGHLQIGLLILEVDEDPEAYGLPPRASAVKHFQEQLPFAKDSLYNDLRVVKTFGQTQAKDLLSKKSDLGAHLAHAHLVEAVRFKGDADARVALLEEALAQGWSTRQLRKVVRERSEKPKAASLAREVRTVVKATRKALTTAKSLRALVDGDWGDDDGDLDAAFEEALSLQRELAKICGENEVAYASKRELLDAESDAAAPAKRNDDAAPAILSASNHATVDASAA